MIQKILLPLLAAMGIAIAVYTVVKTNHPTVASSSAAQPSYSPYKTFVSGAGIVESLSENIEVAPVVPGVVQDIYVKVGDNVTKGQPLWLIDDRDLRADLLVKQAAVLSKSALVKSKQAMQASAQAKYDRLKQQPRTEEIPAFEARVDSDLHSLQDMKDQLLLVTAVSDKRAISQEDLNTRQHAVEIAEAKLRESQANLALAKAGAWDQDLKVANADIATAQADIESAIADVKAAEAQVTADEELIKRLTVTAPVDGRILQVKLHAGEYADALQLHGPLMLIGDVKKLVIRTDVDENDAWRVPREGAKTRAVANVRGNRDITVELQFYRIEPYVIPKKSLTGDSTERVDTRVLEVLYTFEPLERPIYVGQQMDVFIETVK